MAMAIDAESLTKWIRARGILTISCGSRVQLSLALYNGDSVDTEPQETLEAAFAQLKHLVGLREKPRE